MRILYIIKNILITLAYIIVFILCYIKFLNRYFDYSGYELHVKNNYFLILSVIISVIPVILYRGYKALSSFISLFIYILLYIPIILTFGLGSKLANINIFTIQIVFASCMSLLFLADIVSIKAPIKFKKINLIKLIYFLTIITSIYIIYIYKNNLKFVSFNDVYTQRSGNSDLGTDILTRYLSTWLTGFMIPICLTYGLILKKKSYFLVGSFACLVIYMAIAAKGTILLPFIYPLFFILFSKNRLNIIFPIFVLSITFAMTSMLFFTENNIVSSILLSRTIGNGGNLTMWYYDFFLTHPYTYYSHINLIDSITHSYPYSTGLGFTVGNYYWSDTMNANANFWATDGIAALGLIGVVIISIITFFIFIIMNIITNRNDKLFVLLSFIPFIGSLLNTSIFSSFLTGGAFFLLLFFSFHKSEDRILQPT